MDNLNEVSEDTLAKIALAAVAGVATAVGGKHLYKKYKEKKLQKKYMGSQEDDKKKDRFNPYMTSLEPADAVEAAKFFLNAKK